MSVCNSPENNVKNFEKIADNAPYLYEMAFFEDNLDTVVELTAELIDGMKLSGIPVIIEGGMIETSAISNEGTIERTFVPNNREEGIYIGLAWRSYTDQLVPGEEMWRLCHKIFMGEEIVKEYDGNESIVKIFNHISADESEVTMRSFINSHDLRLLENDGFSQKIDEVVLDVNMNKQDLLNLISRMFGVIDVECTNDLYKSIYQHRLSYINSLGIFNDQSTCMVETLYVRKEEGKISILKSKDGFTEAQVIALGFDYMPVQQKAGIMSLNEDKQILCLEVYVEGVGYCSVPCIEGNTNIID